MSDNHSISVSGLGKKYLLGLAVSRHDTLIEVITGRVRSLFRGVLPGKKPADKEIFWALSDVSFQVDKGENVGIIGLNGAGKSTLLKILSRITSPTTGTARIDGRLGALLEVGTGFHPELTGRENVYLYGAILGMSSAEIDRKFDSIVDFAELHKFINTPVKRYSSGMYVRLAFSVAAHLDPDILLLDEVLAVGDLPFQRKCMEFAKNLQQRNATILFVSHNMNSIKTMCNRVIYLKQGRVVFDGPTDEGIGLYERDCQLVSQPAESGSGVPPVAVTELALLDERGQEKSVFGFGERMKLRLKVTSSMPVSNPNFIIAFVRSDQVACCNFCSELDGVALDSLEGDGVLELVTPPLKLVAHSYTIHILVRKPGFGDIIGQQIGGTFHVKDEILDSHFGVFHESADWNWESTGAAMEEAAKVGNPG
jgi:homopolymeric O-antigen transport system ATP-binding protein